MRPKKRPPSNPEYDAELVRAVRAGEATWVEELLEAGADPNTRDERGEPALYGVGPSYSAGFALSDRDARIITALLKAGADPQLDDVAVRLCRMAWRGVASALEANDARRLQQLLGVPDEACLPGRR